MKPAAKPEGLTAGGRSTLGTKPAPDRRHHAPQRPGHQLRPEGVRQNHVVVVERPVGPFAEPGHVDRGSVRVRLQRPRRVLAVRRTVENLKGDVRVRSRVGEGTTFRILLPRDRQGATSTRVTTQKVLPPGSADAGGEVQHPLHGGEILPVEEQHVVTDGQVSQLGLGSQDGVVRIQAMGW